MPISVVKYGLKNKIKHTGKKSRSDNSKKGKEDKDEARRYNINSLYPAIVYSCRVQIGKINGRF